MILFDDCVEQPTPPQAYRQAIEAWKRDFLTAALRATNGNISRTARELGLPRLGLHKALGALGIRPERRRK